MKLSRLLFFFVAATAVLACGGGAAPGAFQPDFKTSGDFFTRMQGLEKGESPHGTVRIWYSTSLERSLGKADMPAPEGSVSIKEFDMQSDGTLDGFAVMVKREAGYDPENGDWYYEMRDASGNVMTDPPAGKTEMCIGCHSAARATDFLAGTTL